jgi:hypothetical protein
MLQMFCRFPIKAQPPEENDSISERQAFTMLKHRCSALLTFTVLKHRCLALMTFMLLKHHWSTLLTCFGGRTTTILHFLLFSVAETPLSTTFPVAETPLPATFIIFPDAETPLFSNFHFFPLPKHSSPPFSHHFHCRNNSVQHLFRLSPSVAETPLSTTFPVAETPLPATFHHFSDAETPLFNNFYFFPLPKHSVRHFPHHFHRRNNSVQQLFRLSPFVAETPSPTTFHYFSRC